MARSTLARFAFLAGFATLARLSALARPAAPGAAALPRSAAALLAAVAVATASLLAQGLFQVGTLGVKLADDLVGPAHIKLVFHNVAIHHLKGAFVGKADQQRLVVLLAAFGLDLSA